MLLLMGQASVLPNAGYKTSQVIEASDTVECAKVKEAEIMGALQPDAMVSMQGVGVVANVEKDLQDRGVFQDLSKNQPVFAGCTTGRIPEDSDVNEVHVIERQHVYLKHRQRSVAAEVIAFGVEVQPWNVPA